MARSIHARFTSKPDHYANGAFDPIRTSARAEKTREDGVFDGSMVKGDMHRDATLRTSATGLGNGPTLTGELLEASLSLTSHPRC